MLSGNTYTFLYIEKYNTAHSKPNPKQVIYTKPTMKRSISRSQKLNHIHNQNKKEDNENNEGVFSDGYFKNYFSSDQTWGSE